MLVLDDGWFGKRNDDRTSLGDWFVNEDKLKGGLRKLVNNINSLGMKFGIWFEPEMISPESELYKNILTGLCIMRVESRDRSETSLYLTSVTEKLLNMYMSLLLGFCVQRILSM